jgi:endo-1,4-beta-xylanase
VFAWDVINEVIDEGKPDGMRASMWYDRPGIGYAGQRARYVDEIFRWARAAAPNTLLFYNDDPSARGSAGDAMLRLVTDVLDRGGPIDGVGLQLHLDLATDLSRLEDELARFGALDLEIHVTELDVAIPTNSEGRPVDPHDLERQAEIYHRVVAACMRLPRCTAIQTWGVDDGHSWIPMFSRGAFGAALLLDDTYRPKPAYQAVVRALDDAVAMRNGERQSS